VIWRCSWGEVAEAEGGAAEVFEASVDNANERGQVRASEGIKHVEVFPIGSVRTPIIGRPRPLPHDRHATPDYTLNCDEPDFTASPHRLQTAGSPAKPPQDSHPRQPDVDRDCCMSR